MAQLFPKWTNHAPWAVPLAAGLALAAAVVSAWYWLSPRFTDAGYRPEQPIAYSHKLHAGDLGLDCRYCHDTVERGAMAAVPPTATCMNCHAVVKAQSPKLVLLREAHAAERPVPWVRVHQLPDFAYFHHGVHLAAGVGCSTCHGRVDQMVEVRMAQPLSMAWCFGCHSDPNPQLRPLDRVTDMAWDPATAPYDPDQDPLRRRPVDPPTHCTGCHR